MADVITVTITGNAAGLTSAVGQATASLGTLESASTKTSGVLGSLFTGAGMAVGLKAIDTLAAGMRGAIDTAIGFNANLEQSTIAFTSMLGSAEKAQAFLAEMKAFAATTPFEYPELLQASKQMMAFGFAASEVKPLLTAVGSAASAMGTGRSGVDSITKALGQMRAATVVQAGELNQLTEQGIPAFQILADAMGISTGEVKKLASEGKIASKVFIDAFQVWAQSNYGDMMAKQALTFEGAVSTIKDSVTFATAEAFKPFFEVISSGAVELSKFVQGETFTTWVTGVAATTRDAFRQIGDAVRTVQQVLAGEWAPSDQIEAFALAVGTAALTLQTTFGPAVTAISTFITGTLVPAIQQFAPQIATFTAGFTGAIVTIGLFSAAIAVVTGVLGALLSPIGLVAIAVGALAVAWQTNFLGIQEATAAAWAAIQPTFAAIVDWLGVQIPPVLEWISTVGWPAMLAAGQAVSAWITGTAIPALTQLVEWLGPQISAVTTWIYATGWPALVTAGEAVGVMVQTVITFFQGLFTELEKRGVFEQLGAIWNTLIDIGGRVWDIVSKVTTAFVGLAAAVVTFLADAAAPVLTWFGDLITQATGGSNALTIVANTIDSMTKAAAGALGILDKMLSTLQAMSQIKISLPGFGGGGATQNLSYTTGGLANPDASDAEIDAYIADAARRRGMSQQDIDRLVELSRRERDAAGKYRDQGAKAVGDSGKSFGPFQLYTGGGVGNEALAAGIDVRDPRTWQQQIEFALDSAITGGYGQWTVGHNMGLAGVKPSGTPQGVKVPNATAGLANITMTQGQWGASVGMSPEEAAAACGPYAAWIFAQATGRTPDPAEAEKLARLSGWTEAGMGGTGNFMNLLGRMGVNAVRDATPTEQEAIAGGPMVGFSTPKHYFASTGYDAATGKFNVGATGTYAGGSTMMSYEEMARIGGGIQDIIMLAGQMGPAFQEAGAEVAAAGAQMGASGAAMNETFTGVASTVGTSGAMMVSATTDTFGNVVRMYSEGGQVIATTVTDTTGQIVQQWSDTGTQVLSATTNALGGQTTIFQEQSGQQVTIVTDAAGQIVSRTTEMATGVTGATTGMTTGVTAATTLMMDTTTATVTTLGQNIITSMTDTAGNVVTTTTDMAGNVIAQHTTMATGVVLQANGMQEGVLTSVTDMGNGIITTVQDTAGNAVSTVTDMAGNVTSQYVTMAEDGGAAVRELGSISLEQFGAVEESALGLQQPLEDLGSTLEDIPQADMSDSVRQFNRAADAARAAARRIKELAEATEDLPGNFGGSRGGSGNIFGRRHSGGPVEAGVPYLVGRTGAEELFVPRQSGHIYAGQTAAGGSGGGATVYQVTVQVNGALLANDRMIEEAVVRGLDSARRRGREP